MSAYLGFTAIAVETARAAADHAHAISSRNGQHLKSRMSRHGFYRKVLFFGGAFTRNRPAKTGHRSDRPQNQRVMVAARPVCARRKIREFRSESGRRRTAGACRRGRRMVGQVGQHEGPGVPQPPSTAFLCLLTAIGVCFCIWAWLPSISGWWSPAVLAKVVCHRWVPENADHHDEAGVIQLRKHGDEKGPRPRPARRDGSR